MHPFYTFTPFISPKELNLFDYHSDSFKKINMQVNAIQKTIKVLLRFGLLSFSVVLLWFSSNSQTVDTIIPINENPEEILRNIRLKTFSGKGFNYWQDKFSGHWMGVDLGFNALVNTDYSTYDSEFMKPQIFNSNSLHLNIIHQSIGLQRLRNNFGMVIGLGVIMREYRIDDNATITKNENGVIIPKSFDYSENQKSKLYEYSIVVPMLFEYQVPIENYKLRYYISGGMFTGYRMASHTKIKYETDETEKLKRSGDFALQNFKYGIMARTGYRWINIFAMYEFSNLFKKDMGPELTPLTFGITLLPL